MMTLTRSVVALSLAVLTSACSESGGAPKAQSMSTSGSPTVPPSSAGGGGSSPDVPAPEPVLGGAAGSPVQAMAGAAGTAGAGGAATQPKSKISVLIVDGFNNHVWQIVTQRYLTILARDPIFDPVVVSTVPPEDDPTWSAWKPDFAAYDVVVQNTTNI